MYAYRIHHGPSYRMFVKYVFMYYSRQEKVTQPFSYLVGHRTDLHIVQIIGAQNSEPPLAMPFAHFMRSSIPHSIVFGFYLFFSQQHVAYSCLFVSINQYCSQILN